jgi:hypothetical protein
MDKQFFMNGTMFVDRVHSFVVVPRAILPSRPPTLQPRRAGAVKAGHICDHRRLGLDRPEHGGTLVRTGTCRLELAVSA